MIDAEIVTLSNARFETFQGSPGSSMSVDLETYGENTDDGELYGGVGSVGRPQDNETGLKVTAKGQNIIIATHNYNLSISLEKGEHKIFSYDANGNILSSALCNKDGEFVVNGGTDYAVAFDKLKIEFNKLKDAWDAFATAYVPGSPTVTGLPATASTSGSNIDNAKVEKVRI